MKATTAIILETRKLQKSGKYPVKLRVTYNRECHYYTVKNEQNETIQLTKDDYQKVIAERPRKEFKDLKIYLVLVEDRAAETIKSLPLFTFDTFEKRFFGEEVEQDEKDLFSGLKAAALRLRAEGRISTASSYECSLNSLKNFTKKEKLSYEKVDIPFLNKYEVWMQKEGNSMTTIGIYLRNVRTLYLESIAKGVTKQAQYPFGRNKYEIPVGRNIKKALTLKEVGLIAAFPVIQGTSEARYRDYWLFSYNGNGMNIKDMAYLKYSNISDDVITFNRAKTMRTTKARPQPITIVITDIMANVIKRWGNKPESPEKYVFPILSEGISPEKERADINQTVKQINKYVGRIAQKAGIKSNVTTYTARHSFATVLKRSGASTEFISESLGHRNMKTTENYLADFETDVKREWAKQLNKFED